MKTCTRFLLIFAFSIGAKVNASVKRIERSISNMPNVKLLDTTLDDDGLSSNHGINYADILGRNFSNSDFKLELDEGNPDYYARIERPCEVYDSYCIRHFFAEHSKCHISAKPVPNPLHRAELAFYVPNANITVAAPNAEYRGLHTGKVREFYINKATDNLVITIEFDFVAFYGYAYFLYNRIGKEPLVHADYGGIRFETTAVTVIVPQLNDLRLDKADISAYSAIPFYSYYFAPGLVPEDPEAVSGFVAFNTNLRVSQAEILLTDASFYAATFIQYNICDFGLKIV